MVRVYTSTAGGTGFIPGQRLGMLQLRLKIPCATTKIWHSQTNFKKEKEHQHIIKKIQDIQSAKK